MLMHVYYSLIIMVVSLITDQTGGRYFKLSILVCLTTQKSVIDYFIWLMVSFMFLLIVTDIDV